MNESTQINNESKLQTIFNTMDYGENLENTDKAAEWVKAVDITDKSAELKSILDWAKENLGHEFTENTKTQLLTLAKQIEKNADMFAQIEIFARSILSKDTRKAVTLLAEYFSYYANFTGDLRKGACVAVICDDENPLWVLGLVVAPALAAGYPIVLQTGIKLAPAANFLLTLAETAGIPQAALKLIPSSEGGLQEYLDHDYVDVVVLFGDLLDGKYHAVNRHFKKFLALSPRTGASMIVFDDSDTSSAAEAVVDAAWGYQGMLPWTIDTVLIQENVFAMFTDKLKEKLASVRVGYGDDKLADISYPNCQALSVRQARTVRRAKDQGIEVYSPDLPTDVFAPTLLIGAKAYSNYVIVGGERDGCVTLLPFRSIDEAVNLTNNTRHGFGASVWTENVGLANEVAAKVTVGNVWLNGHGLIAPDVTFVSLKDSGAGYFGGAQGFREFTEEPKSLDASGKEGGAVIDLRVGTAINVAVGAGARWSKRAFLDRVNALREVADGLGGCFAGKFADELRRCVIDKAEWGTSSRPGYVVTPWTNARGVVAIDLESDQDSNASLLARALARGNAVIALNRYPRNPIYAEISKGLPSGLLSVFPHTVEMELVCANHKALNLFLSPLPRAAVAGQSVADSKNLTIKLTGDINWRLVFPKNVWYSVGRSLTCDL